MTANPMTNSASRESVRLTVNAETCIGSGICEMLAKEAFLVDEDTNIASIVGDGVVAADRARKLIDACPSSAISISDDPTDG